MNDHDVQPDPGLEQQVNSWLVETDLTPEEARTGLERVLHEFPVAPQVRGHLLGRWLRRDDGTGVPDAGRGDASGSGRRNTLVLSAVAATAAALAVAVLAVDTVRMEPVPDTRERLLVVAADGTGDYATIAEAVAEAGQGDTIRIAPGTYTEAIVIDKDITLIGGGPREDVVITAPDDGPLHSFTEGPTEPYAIALMGSDADISGLTLHGERSALLVDGGSPTLRDLHFLAVSEPFAGAGNTDTNALVIAGGSRATLSDSILDRSGPVGVYDSDPLIIGNTLQGGSHIWGRFGDDAIIMDNHIDGALNRAIGVQGSGAMLIEDNIITGHGVHAIEVGMKGDTAARIRNNRIVDASTGISVRDGEGVEVSGNELIGNDIGVRISRSTGSVTANAIGDGEAGIVVVSGGTPMVSDNVVDVSGRGIVAGSGTSPHITGNDVCGGDVGIHISEDATADVVDNRICGNDAVKL